MGLGVVIGNRMSTEAMGVVVGVMLGVAASIPMTLLVMLFLNRQDNKPEQPTEQPPTVYLVDGRNIPRDSQIITQAPEGYYAGGRYRQIPPPRDGRVN